MRLATLEDEDVERVVLLKRHKSARVLKSMKKTRGGLVDSD